MWVWGLRVEGLRPPRAPTGHRSYLVEYRPGAGGRSAPKRRVTIGRHGSPWTPETARREAERILGLVASGADPAANKAALRGAPTVAEFWRALLGGARRPEAEGGDGELYRAMADRFGLSRPRPSEIREVTRQDVVRLHTSHRETPYQANRCLALVSALFSYAELMGERPAASNPARGVERFGEEARERLLSAFELGASARRSGARRARGASRRPPRRRCRPRRSGSPRPRRDAGPRAGGPGGRCSGPGAAP